MLIQKETIRTLKKTGRGPSQKPRKRMGGLRRAATVFASALLTCALLFAPQKANAEEAKALQKAGVGVKMGAGYNHFDEQFRAIVGVNAEVPLPFRTTLSGAMAISSTSDGSAQWEETNLNLDIPIWGPLFADLYGYNSKHGFVPTLSTGADIGAGLKWGAVIAGYEYLFDFDTGLVFGVVKLNAIKGMLSLKFNGAYVFPDSGAAGAGFSLTPGGRAPDLGVHTLALVDKSGVSGMDTIATLGWNF